MRDASKVIADALSWSSDNSPDDISEKNMCIIAKSFPLVLRQAAESTATGQCLQEFWKADPAKNVLIYAYHSSYSYFRFSIVNTRRSHCSSSCVVDRQLDEGFHMMLPLCLGRALLSIFSCYSADITHLYMGSAAFHCLRPSLIEVPFCHHFYPASRLMSFLKG